MRAVSRYAVSTALALGCLFTTPQVGFAIQLQPGLWEETETGTENGQPVEAQTDRSCMTPEEAKDPIKGLQLDKEAQGQCKTFDVKQTGNSLTLRMQCGQPGQFAMDLTANYTFLSPQRYTGSIQSTIMMGNKKLTSDKKIDARRVGACSG